MSTAEQRIFPARRDRLQQALDFVEAYCEHQALAGGTTMRMVLIVEELFSNTLKHGHHGDADVPVRITLQLDASQLALCYEDSAPPFDPLRYMRESPPALDSALEQRLIGKMGLPLVAHMAAQMGATLEYAHIDGFNRLRLVLRRDG